MTLKSALFRALPAPVSRRLGDRLARFNEWRADRPFWGGFLLMLGGLLIGWVPLEPALNLAVIGEPTPIIGLLWAVIVFLSGAFALSRPDQSRVFGIAGIAASVLSLFGALGGLFVGMLLGIFGGCLCVAWMNPESQSDTDTEAAASEEAQFSWQDDQ